MTATSALSVHPAGGVGGANEGENSLPSGAASGFGIAGGYEAALESAYYEVAVESAYFSFSVGGCTSHFFKPQNIYIQGVLN